jgi:pimeloyl-ACP methyl ester carboxylesterase
MFRRLIQTILNLFKGPKSAAKLPASQPIPNMEPILLIHGYSSEGKTDKDVYTLQEVEALFGGLRNQLIAMFDVEVTIVNVSRYISLDDKIGIDDLSLAMDRALQSLPPNLTSEMEAKGFNVITHSTGALVARNWVRRHSANSKCKMKRVVHLAGANSGSGWAHIGESLVAKWGREIFGHTSAASRFWNRWNWGLIGQSISTGTSMTRVGKCSRITASWSSA